VPSAVTFSQLPASESAASEVRIYAYRDDHLTIRGETFSDPATADKFDVSVTPLTADQLREEADARSGVLLRITAKPGLPLGRFGRQSPCRRTFPIALPSRYPLRGP